MVERNWLTGLLIATTSLCFAVFSDVPAMAQSLNSGYQATTPWQFNQQLPVQQATQQTPTLQAYAQTNYQPSPQPVTHQLYTPNINGVPLDPNTPRSGLDQFGFDGHGHAYNNLTEPQYANYPYNAGNVSNANFTPAASGANQSSYNAATAAYAAGNPAYGAGYPAYNAGNPTYSAGNPAYSSGNPTYSAGNPTYSAGNPAYSSGNPNYNSNPSHPFRSLLQNLVSNLAGY